MHGSGCYRVIVMQHPFSHAGYRYWVRGCLVKAVFAVSVIGIIDALITHTLLKAILDMKKNFLNETMLPYKRILIIWQLYGNALLWNS